MHTDSKSSAQAVHSEVLELRRDYPLLATIADELAKIRSAGRRTLLREAQKLLADALRSFDAARG